MLSKIITNYPVNDRNFDYNHQELSQLQLLGKLVDTVNHLIDEINSFQGSIDGKEDSVNITRNRKLSSTGNFTGSIFGRMGNLVLSGIDSNSDKIRFLSGQFADGYTGQVIDGGFFYDSLIKRNYDGGIFPKSSGGGGSDDCCEIDYVVV